MSKAIPTIDAILEAARDWRFEPGDPTLAKFLALVIDLHKAATHPAPGLCNVCCGSPLPSGKKCICGGAGTEWAETQGLRELCFELEDKLADRADALKQLELNEVPKQLKQFAEFMEQGYPADIGIGQGAELRRIAAWITDILPYKLTVPDIKVKV